MAIYIDNNTTEQKIDLLALGDWKTANINKNSIDLIPPDSVTELDNIINNADPTYPECNNTISLKFYLNNKNEPIADCIWYPAHDNSDLNFTESKLELDDKETIYFTSLLKTALKK